jgi:hypothetical protein
LSLAADWHVKTSLLIEPPFRRVEIISTVWRSSRITLTEASAGR